MKFFNITSRIDWIIVALVMPFLFFGLVTMRSLGTESQFFSKQLIWVAISFIAMIVISQIDFNFLQHTKFVILFYAGMILLLIALFVINQATNGALSWINFGSFSFQPADFVKLALILVMAKYFSRRYIEITRFKHIFISALYAFIPFLLIMLQPDFGSAIILAAIWFGVVSVSGISWKQFVLVLAFATLFGLLMWNFGFDQFQKNRILTFLHPVSDLSGTGYNAHQSMIAVGSGQFIGKGVGFGTQSRLQFLPEYETDFIFAAFAEEWGFVGVILVILLYNILITRILSIAWRRNSNFERLFCVGVAILLLSHMVINIGMNIGILPVTGITLPMMSYGGSHLLMIFISLGIIMSIEKGERRGHIIPDNEVLMTQG